MLVWYKRLFVIVKGNRIRMFWDPLLFPPSPKKIDSSKPEEFADDIFEFDKNCRKFSRRVENNGGKGEIARFEQFLHFTQCFQKTYPGGM